MNQGRQAERYQALMEQRKPSSIDSSYHAAFYLLSASEELFQIAKKYTHTDGINFAKIKKECGYLDEKLNTIVDIAHNLFSWCGKTDITPFDISRLGYPFMEQVCHAIFIASGEVKVFIQENNQGSFGILFDDQSYQQTKNVHERLSGLTEQYQNHGLTMEEEAIFERE